MSKEKLIGRISQRLSINGEHVNHGMVGSTYMISVSKAINIVKEELEKSEK